MRGSLTIRDQISSQGEGACLLAAVMVREIMRRYFIDGGQLTACRRNGTLDDRGRWGHFRAGQEDALQVPVCAHHDWP